MKGLRENQRQKEQNSVCVRERVREFPKRMWRKREEKEEQ